MGLTGRNAVRLAAVAAECRRRGAEVETAELDVREAGALADWLTGLDVRAPIGTLIASAGVSAGVAPGQLGEGAELATLQVASNLIGAINTVEPVLPLMLQRGYGRIALISSLAGLRGLPYSPGYSASKAGVRAYGEALRTLCGPAGVRVTVACPGFFDTPMTDRWHGPTPFLSSVEKTARGLQAAVDKGRPRWGFPWPLILGMKLGDLGPTWITDPIFRGFHFNIERP